MTEATITDDLRSACPHLHVVVAEDNAFYFYSPEGVMPERTIPFATLMVNDAYDAVSQLHRPGVFRLNVGLTKTAYERLLGPLPSAPGNSGTLTTGHDFTALNTIMPHPIYGHMGWVCVLNPSADTYAALQPLLAEAYERAAEQTRQRSGKDAREQTNA